MKGLLRRPLQAFSWRNFKSRFSEECITTSILRREPVFILAVPCHISRLSTLQLHPSSSDTEFQKTTYTDRVQLHVSWRPWSHPFATDPLLRWWGCGTCKKPRMSSRSSLSTAEQHSCQLLLPQHTESFAASGQFQNQFNQVKMGLPAWVIPISRYFSFPCADYI